MYTYSSKKYYCKSSTTHPFINNISSSSPNFADSNLKRMIFILADHLLDSLTIYMINLSCIFYTLSMQLLRITFI